MKRKLVIRIGFGLYALLLIWLVMFKLEPRFFDIFAFRQAKRSINLIPFAACATANGRLALSEPVLNLLAFVPLGIYLSLLDFPKGALFKIALGLLVSLGFETAQFAFSIGAADITDLLTNTLGTALGVLIGFWCKKRTDAVGTVLLVLELISICAYALLLLMQ